MELHPFWRQDELVKFCQEKGIHVSAHTPLGVPATSNMLTSGAGLSDSGSEDELGTPRISFRRSRSVHGPMLKLSAVAEIADRHNKTPEQVCFRCPLLLEILSEQSNLRSFKLYFFGSIDFITVGYEMHERLARILKYD